jgi:predicted HicB family RNase H-like nuclease
MNTTAAVDAISHGGYTARIEFDERDNIFIGRVLGLRSIISFHADTAAQLRREFVAALEDYLSDYQTQGIEPEKPASGKLLLRVPPELHSRALVLAQARGKSLNQWATEALQRAVADGA